MKVSCIIVEDEPLARNLLTDYVSKVPHLHLIEACPTPLRALEVLHSASVDLMFLDIQMPEITGITLLRSLEKKPLVILTTAYSEYALESYELDVVDYLLKPVTFDRFLKGVERATQRLRTSAQPRESSAFVFIKDGTKLVKINYDDILYVEGLKDYVTIVTPTQKVVSLQRLKVLEETLPTDKFMRVHHSYIVAIGAIDAIHKTELRIGPHLIPISESYRKEVREFVERHHM